MAYCAYPYCPDEDVSKSSGYLAEHFLVAVNSDNLGTAKWVPEDGYLPVFLEDFDNDGVIDQLTFSGTLINTGFLNPSHQNQTLEVNFVASDPVSFASCSLEGGIGSLDCPKCELGLCDGGQPYVNWTFFKNIQGAISGDDVTKISNNLEDGICRLNVTDLPLIQLGRDGGNAKNFKFGLSGWINCDGDPAPGLEERHVADFNIDIRKCYTPEPTSSPTSTPSEAPSRMPTMSPTLSPSLRGELDTGTSRL